MCTKLKKDSEYIKIGREIKQEVEFSKILNEINKIKESESYYLMVVKFGKKDITLMQSINKVSSEAIGFVMGKVFEKLKN